MPNRLLLHIEVEVTFTEDQKHLRVVGHSSRYAHEQIVGTLAFPELVPYAIGEAAKEIARQEITNHWEITT